MEMKKVDDDEHDYGTDQQAGREQQAAHNGTDNHFLWPVPIYFKS